MQSNEMKKGMKGTLKNGWSFTCMDNKKGNIRMLEVDGRYKEIGSVYVWDIATVEGKVLELTPAQEKARKLAVW